MIEQIPWHLIVSGIKLDIKVFHVASSWQTGWLACWLPLSNVCVSKLTICCGNVVLSVAGITLRWLVSEEIEIQIGYMQNRNAGGSTLMSMNHIQIIGLIPRPTFRLLHLHSNLLPL